MDEFTPPPVPPPEPPPTASTPPVAVEQGTGLPQNLAATICAALPLLGGIIFLVLEKRNAFVRFWAMQSVFFGALCFGFSIFLQIVTFILAHIPILGWILLLVLWLASMVFWLGTVVVWVLMIIKAFSNVEWEIPYLGKLARRQLATQKLV